jgi:hypothetical protein
MDALAADVRRAADSSPRRVVTEAEAFAKLRLDVDAGNAFLAAHTKP